MEPQRRHRISDNMTELTDRMNRGKIIASEMLAKNAIKITPEEMEQRGHGHRSAANCFLLKNIMNQNNLSYDLFFELVKEYEPALAPLLDLDIDVEEYQRTYKMDRERQHQLLTNLGYFKKNMQNAVNITTIMYAAKQITVKPEQVKTCGPEKLILNVMDQLNSSYDLLKVLLLEYEGPSLAHILNL